MFSGIQKNARSVMCLACHKEFRNNAAGLKKATKCFESHDLLTDINLLANLLHHKLCTHQEGKECWWVYTKGEKSKKWRKYAERIQETAKRLKIPINEAINLAISAVSAV